MLRIIPYDSQRDEHQGLGENDRHHIGCEELQGDILASTTILLVANQTLCILNGNLASTLHQQN